MENRVILKGSDIFPYIHGAREFLINENKAVETVKFTNKQIETYAQDEKKYGFPYTRILTASAGITLEMDTDSEFLGMDITWEVATGSVFMSFDLYVDGLLTDSRVSNDQYYNKLFFELPKGMHRVSVYFPWSVKVIINSIHLSKNSVAKPVHKDRRVLILGDSISQGFAARHASCTYVNTVARKLDAEILNLSVSGYVFNQASLDESFSSFCPDLIITAYGTNDFGRKGSLSEFENDAFLFMEKLHGIFPNVPVVSVMPIVRKDVKFTDRRGLVLYSLEESFDALRRVYAKFDNVSVLEDHFFPRNEDFFNEDLLHPNDLGFSFYAEAVLNRIKTLGIF